MDLPLDPAFACVAFDDPLGLGDHFDVEARLLKVVVGA
jgi:hypothetical protein